MKKAVGKNSQRYVTSEHRAYWGWSALACLAVYGLSLSVMGIKVPARADLIPQYEEERGGVIPLAVLQEDTEVGEKMLVTPDGMVVLVRGAGHLYVGSTWANVRVTSEGVIRHMDLVQGANTVCAKDVYMDRQSGTLRAHDGVIQYSDGSLTGYADIVSCN